MYLVIDAEMGGRGLDKSLLSVAMIVADEKLETQDVLGLFIKPNDDVYHVTAEALGVNGIKLVEHDKIAISYDAAKQKIYTFLDSYSSGGSRKLRPIGLGVRGDIDHICNKTVSKRTWDHFCTYTYIDIGSLWTALSLVEKIDQLKHPNLWNMTNYFCDEAAPLPSHTAISDAQATLFVFQKLMEILRQ